MVYYCNHPTPSFVIVTLFCSTYYVVFYPRVTIVYNFVWVQSHASTINTTTTTSKLFLLQLDGSLCISSLLSTITRTAKPPTYLMLLECVKLMYKYNISFHIHVQKTVKKDKQMNDGIKDIDVTKSDIFRFQTSITLKTKLI